MDRSIGLWHGIKTFVCCIGNWQWIVVSVDCGVGAKLWIADFYNRIGLLHWIGYASNVLLYEGSVNDERFDS